MSKKQPQLIAYCVKNRGKGQSAIWTKVGAAWSTPESPASALNSMPFRWMAGWF